MQWPTCGRIGDITHAVWRVPNALERRRKSAVAHKWADWLHNPCRLGGVPNASERGIKSAVPHMSVDWLHIPYCLGGPQRFKAGDKIGGGPHVGILAT